MSESNQKPSTLIPDSDVAYEEFSNIRAEVKPGEKNDFENRLAEALESRKNDDLISRQAEKIVAAERDAERYKEVSRIDPLTGILNRRGFEENVARQLAKGVGGLVLMIDADHFKDVNDRYGHPIGDEILKRIGLSLQTNTQMGRDIVGRWGGEEFVAFLTVSNPDLEADKIYEIAERIRTNMVNYLAEIRHEVSRSGRIEEILIPVTFSFGATIASDEPWEKAFQRADDNLYKAKTSGRDQSIGDNGKIVLTPTSAPGVPPEMPSS